ncbi:gas vesicle protein GvpU [Sporosarcina sp. Marseille-Q4063]|uniref:gas vesicle accessory protein GvpU n=1 Tax=Sporosarcina sp. Marseille-Q4063 TaxID=2810514 RepID=UPI001BAFA41C|nr:gas vesicle accessory protein GvpU [Sporosarcina sp. Marseille-Q4063]QUW20506.1 gas vesicle protein GvpU [Sporosarcina sp. Marseille-Q4063]
MGNRSGHNKDNILEFLVQAANKHDFNLDITLNVKGAVITGTLVSAKEYFSTLSATLEDGNDIAQKLSEQLDQAGETAQNNDETEANFLHMKDTKVYCGDSKPTPSKGEILWRGKLSEIDGFFLGRILDGSDE